MDYKARDPKGAARGGGTLSSIMHVQYHTGRMPGNLLNTELKHPTPLGMETLDALPHMELVSLLTSPRSSALQAASWLESF